MYGRGLRRPNEYRIGDPLNFGIDTDSYFDRQRRAARTTESGIYLGQQDPEYPLYSGTNHSGNPLNNETGGSTGGSSDDFK